MAVLITAVLIMAELKPIQCQEQWLCSPFLAAIDPIYQIPVYCMQRPKVSVCNPSGLVPNTPRIQFILELMSAYLAANLFGLKMRLRHILKK